jgi:hypothetical protein
MIAESESESDYEYDYSSDEDIQDADGEECNSSSKKTSTFPADCILCKSKVILLINVTSFHRLIF